MSKIDECSRENWKTITSSGPPAFFPHLRVQGEARDTADLGKSCFSMPIARDRVSGSHTLPTAWSRSRTLAAPDPYQRVRADRREEP